MIVTLAQLDPIALGALGFLVGLLLGLLHFGTLRQVTRLYTTGGAGKALALQLTRLVLLAAVLFGLALLGAVALLAGAVGLLAARWLVIRRTRESL